MFREMRRKDKQISHEECIEILDKAEHGTLSTISSNGYPYLTPLNYVFFDNSIYFHSAIEGKKLDNIEKCDKVSFCVTHNVKLLSDKFDTNYESVILFGRAKEVREIEKEEALLALINKYSKEFINEGKGYIKKAKAATKVLRIDIEHITGKTQK